MLEGNAVAKEDQLQIEVRRRSCVEIDLSRGVLLRSPGIDVRETGTGIAVSKKTAMI